MEFFQSIIRLLVRSIANSMLQLVSEKVIRQALINNQKYVWQDQDQKVLESFLNGATGAKLMAHLDSSCSGMLVSPPMPKNLAKPTSTLTTPNDFSRPSDLT